MKSFNDMDEIIRNKMKKDIKDAITNSTLRIKL